MFQLHNQYVVKQQCIPLNALLSLTASFSFLYKIKHGTIPTKVYYIVCMVNSFKLDQIMLECHFSIFLYLHVEPDFTGLSLLRLR